MPLNRNGAMSACDCEAPLVGGTILGRSATIYALDYLAFARIGSIN